MSTTRPTSSQIRHQNTTVDKMLGTSPAASGSLKDAGLVGGFIRVSEDTTTNTETSLIAGTKLESSSLITSTAAYFTFVPQANVSIRGGKYKHNMVASVVRTAIGGARGLRLENMDIEGSIVPSGSPSYCLDIRDTLDFAIMGCSVSKYTGAVFVNGSRDGYIENLHASNLVYHPSLVAGGYGILLADARRIVVNGLFFEANANNGANGRHAFYVSNNGTEATKCYDITLNNIYATYTNIDDRNMWAGNIRACDGVNVDNFVVDGANGGLAFNPEQGNLNRVRVTNSKFVVLQYAEGVGVYGISGAGRDTQANPERDLTNFIIDNCTIQVRRKPGFTGTTACVALSFGGSNSIFSNLVITTEDSGGNSSPIMLYDSKALVFDNITLTTAGSNPMFYFAKPVSGLKFSNIKTPGAVFTASNLTAMGTDISVDWVRTANVGVNAGVVTKSDNDSLISTITTTANDVVVTFNSHVTAAAVNAATLNCRIGTSANIVGVSGKTLTVRVFSGSTLISPATGALNFDVKLSS